jgi:hypothetical protein
MDVSFVSGLIIGCFIGVVAQYFLQRISGNRDQLEEQMHKKIDWNELFNNFPLFMNSIKTDANDPECNNIREFFVVEQHAVLNSSIPRLRYELSEDNIAAVNTLEELGYIERIINNCLLYKMKEHFIRQLRSTT